MEFDGMLLGLVLAAGGSSRMGGVNKLLLDWRGEPLVTRCVREARASRLDEVLVITGHESDAVVAALAPDTLYLENPDWRDGLASSLRAGIEVLDDARGVMVLLPDMPGIVAEHMNWLIAHFADTGRGSIVVAGHDGGHGNPVLFSAAHFGALLAVEGDRGARALVEGGGSDVVTVRVGPAAARDLDTPEAYRSATGREPSMGPNTV